MAIDTRNRRASAVGVMLPFMGCLPLADGTIDADDRRQLAACYAGLSTPPPSEITVYPDPFLATTVLVAGRADPWAARSRLKGS